MSPPRYTGVLPLDRRREIVREIRKGDELQLDGVTWRVTQVIDHRAEAGEVAAYAGPVNPRTNAVRYDRAILDVQAWCREYAKQHPVDPS